VTDSLPCKELQAFQQQGASIFALCAWFIAAYQIKTDNTVLIWQRRTQFDGIG